MTNERRGSLPAYTSGWFQVGWSRELKAGQVREVRQFGLKLAMFRGNDGCLGILDAICPHLGASLAHGSVEGNCLVCPYHRWSFDASGACIEIPNALEVPANAKTRGWAARERYGMIFVHRSQPRADESVAELPHIEDFSPGDWCRPAAFNFTLGVPGQDIMENSVDSAHFTAVHGHRIPTTTFRSSGRELRIDQQTQVRKFGFNIRTKLEFHLIEPGFHYMRCPDTPGSEAMVFSSITPVDEESVNHRITIWVRKTRVPAWTWLIKRFLVSQMIATYREDLAIWKEKSYLDRPVLCSYDTGIMKMRAWYSQFYDEAEKTGGSKAAAQVSGK